MKNNEVVALIIGVVGFLILRVIYLGDAIPSPNGLFDLRPWSFGLGIVFVAVFGFLMGWENRK
ncbi:MAG: hypothetical protein M0R80_03675 [Proteobacteria bacterium]|nr:hypothetical protein [Pseudomonadota bacterium]